MVTSGAGRVATFVAELKRRKVYRVTAIYVVLAIGALEIASLLLPSTRLPQWFDELILGLVIAGLPLVLVLSWAFDLTETGIERTPDRRDRSVEETRGAHAVVPKRKELDPLAVAVLPFENLSGVDTAEPFALGLHDDLLTELSRASALTVISRTSVKGYRASDKSIPQIAQELGAGTIVEGGVQQAGNRIRLNIQLIDARRDGHIWAERYDRELTADNIFELQTELAGRIMAELRAQLTAAERAQTKAQPTGDLEAYQLLATGRRALVDRSEEGYRAAAALFERAIGRDPEYALAWAGLCDALVGLVDYGHVAEGGQEILERGADACRRALALDPHLAEAHAARGQLRTAVRDAPGAVAAHTRAAELQPNYAGAYQWLCWSYLLLNDGPRAREFGLKATRLDPFDPEAAGNLAAAHLMVGDVEAALAESHRILVKHPSFEYALWTEGLSLQALGRWSEAVPVMTRLRDRWTRGWPEVARLLEGSGRAERGGGAHPARDEPDARQALERLHAEGVPFKAGVVHASLGEVDEALAAIRRAGPLPWDETLYLYVHTTQPMSVLRADAGFARLLADVVSSWRAEDA